MNDGVPSSFDVPISSYSEDVGDILESLTRPPLNLPLLDEYVPQSTTDHRIIANLTILRDEYSLFLPKTIKAIIPQLPNTILPGNGKATKFVDPKLRFARLLEKALSKIREEAKVWVKTQESFGRDAESLQMELDANRVRIREECVEEDEYWDEEKEDAERDCAEVIEDSEEEVEVYEGPSHLRNSGIGRVVGHVLDEKLDIPSSGSGYFEIASPPSECFSVSPVKRPANAAESPLKKSRHEESRTSLQKRIKEECSPQHPARNQASYNLPPLKPASYRPPVSAASSLSTISRKSASTDTIDTTLTYPSSREASPTPEPISWNPRAPVPPAEKIVPILARNPYQHVLDIQDTHFAVQWEFERQIARSSTISWENVEMEDIGRLKGSCEEIMPAVDALIKDIEARKAGRAESPNRYQANTTRKAQMCIEMDKEEASIRANDLRGVGNDSIDWSYGGKIVYSIAVEPVKSGSFPRPQTGPVIGPIIPTTPTHRNGPTDPPGNPFSPHPSQQPTPKPLPFTMSLLPPNMPGKSYRLARRFGSRRILSMKLKNLEYGSGVRVLDFFLGREFVLFGRHYAPIWAPPDKDVVFMVEVGGAMPGVHRLLSMYNDLTRKPEQAMAKWAARPQILFSDSVPATTVDIAAIGQAPELITLRAERQGYASTEQILTDGCGLMSESLARRIFQHPSLRPDTGRPCVVQIRLGGSKGLLALMSPEQHQVYAGKEVILRESMVKSLPHPSFADDISLRKLDVLRCDALRIGTTLSSEAIICMAHNGVPPGVFVKMSDESLEELRQAFLPYPVESNGKMETDVQVIKRIVRSCYTIGGVGAERKKRSAMNGGKSLRAVGLEKDRGSKADNDDEVGDGDGELIGLSERYDIDPVSGQSGSIAESLLEAVSAGFHPATSAYSAGKLHHLLGTLTNSRLRKSKIPVAESLSAFIIPDSQQILAPDEIQISFSGLGPIDPTTQCPLTHLEGQVLAFRSPCKLPTDIRKFKAVYRPELSHLTDCVIMSAQAINKRSPASFLGGGDYDGDTVQLFWAKRLVDGFKNAADEFADTPGRFEVDNFDKEVVKGSELLEAVKRGKLGEEGMVMGMQEFLLGALKDEKLAGQYSDLHGNAVYTLGYDHPETIRLARMFCLVLDARKSGLKVKTDVKKRDLKVYHGNTEWRKYKKDMGDEWNEKMLHRPSHLGSFIMDTLQESGKEKCSQIMRDFPALASQPAMIGRKDYNDLSPLWLRAKSRSENRRPESKFVKQVNIIEKHVQACHDIWSSIRNRRLDRGTSILSTYQSIMAGRKDVIKPSPRRNGFERSDSKKGIKSDQDDLIMLTAKRDLAIIWREQVDLKDLQDLIPLGDECGLRRLLISCGVCISTVKWKMKNAHQLFIFDVDFRTACAMKAECGGLGTMTTIEDIGRGLKPVSW